MAEHTMHLNEAIQWQQVTCSRCKRTYQCTPQDDYYGCGVTDPGLQEGVCFTCLLILSGRDPETTRVMVIYADDTEADLPRGWPHRDEIRSEEGTKP